MKIYPHVYSRVDLRAYGRRIGKSPYIVVHYSNSGPDTTVDDINLWHLNNGWNGLGYHAVILPSGRIIRGRPVWAMGAHCAGHNDCLGVCFISKDGHITTAQITSGKWLILRWRNNCNIPKTRIKRHRDMSGNYTACPGILPMKTIVG